MLLYHHVADSISPFVRMLGITIAANDFKEHIRFLTSQHTVVPFSRLPEHADDAAAVVITFDDGFHSFKTTALPILEEYNCPAKLYIVGCNIDEQANWLDRLSFLFSSLDASTMADLADQCLISRSSQTSTRRRRNPPQTSVSDFIERFDFERTPQTIKTLFGQVFREPPGRLYLDEEELRSIAMHPLVELGSHTRSHYPLPCLSPEQLHKEVVVNHTDLQRRIGPRVQGFCVPFGYRSHLTQDVVAAVRQIDGEVLSAYGGRVGDSTVFGMREIRRVGVWGNLGTLWYRMRYGVDGNEA